MTITTTAVAGFGVSPRVLVSVSSSPSVTDFVTVYRTHPDGTVWKVLLEDNAILVGAFSGFDYHAPFNQNVTYHSVVGAQTSAATSPVPVISSSSWLIHPSDPDLSVRVEAFTWPVPTRSRAVRVSRYQPLNRKLPTHRTFAPRGGEEGTLTVYCPTEAVEVAMNALLDDGGPILLNSKWSAPNFGWKWIQPGDMTTEAPGGLGDPVRLISFSYEETTQPDVDSAPVWTLEDLRVTALTSFPTLADLAAAGYDDLNALKLNVL